MLPWLLALLAPPIELEWKAPNECPSEAAFTEMVETQIDVRTDASVPVVLAADVTIAQRADRTWELLLTLHRTGDSEEDTRTFEADTCHGVVEAAAFIVSMRVIAWSRDSQVESKPELIPEPPSAASPRSEPSSTSRPPPEPVARTSTRVAPDEPAARTRARPPIELRGWVGLHAGLALGVTPGVGGAVAIEGGVEAPWWRAGLALQTAPRRIRPHPDDASIRGRFDLVVAQAFGCVVPSAGPVDFATCGRVAGGGLRGTGEGGVQSSEPAWGRWWGLGGSAGVVWHVSERLAPALSAEALAPGRPRSYSVGDLASPLRRTGPVAFRTWAGLEIHL